MRKWYVFNMDDGGEVSVNYGDPKNHSHSYGWADLTKIIIGDGEINNEQTELKKLEIAHTICNKLNENKIIV